MILKRLKISTWIGDDTNCYIVFDPNSKETMVVDPAGDVDRICDMIDILQGQLKYIFLTHCHGDHIAGVTELKNKKGGKILIHRYDSEGLNNPEINLTEFMLGLPEIELEADSRIDDGDLYLQSQKLLFSGDTLFRGTWGRTDLPTSSFQDIMSSIIKKLLILPEDTIVYPGHR